MLVTKKSSKTKRVESAKSLAEKVTRAKTLIFANYHGLTVNQIADLRGKIKNVGGELLVAKNTLLSRALSSTNYQLPTTNLLIGPTAAIFAYEDEIAPIKETATLAKTLGVPKFKFGFFAKRFLEASDIEELARIPTRDVLQAQVVGTLSSPIYGVVSVLQANIRNLVSVIDQVSKKSQSQSG